jgi:alkylhydroperoxidase family enzyme
VLEDYEKAPISERLRAMLRYLDKMTRQPDALGPADARALFEHRISPSAARDAIYVAYVFAVYCRLADTLGFAMPDDDYTSGVKILLSFIGYG